MNSSTRRRLWPWAVTLGVAVAAGVALYKFFEDLEDDDLDFSSSDQLEQSIKYTNKPITIILTESILSSKIPLIEILNKTENIVLVIPPDLSLADLPEIDDSISYKVIETDTYEGVWSVVKHLKSEVVFVVNDDLKKDIPEDVGRYVNEIIQLGQNNTEINGRILSYIIT